MPPTDWSRGLSLFATWVSGVSSHGKTPFSFGILFESSANGTIKSIRLKRMRLVLSFGEVEPKSFESRRSSLRLVSSGASFSVSAFL